MMVARPDLVGRWRITESEAWPRDHLDLCGPAFLLNDDDGTGEMAFGALTASVDGRFTASGIDFEWNGADEGDQVSGTGWADLRDDGRLEGEIAYDKGDDTTSSPNHGVLQQPAKERRPTSRRLDMKFAFVAKHRGVWQVSWIREARLFTQRLSREAGLCAECPHTQRRRVLRQTGRIARNRLPLTLNVGVKKGCPIKGPRLF